MDERALARGKKKPFFVSCSFDSGQPTWARRPMPPLYLESELPDSDPTAARTHICRRKKRTQLRIYLRPRSRFGSGDARFMSNVCPSIPWSSNLATFGSSRSRSLAGSFRSFDRRRGAAAQIRSGRERGGGGGLREIMRGRKHFLGANRPPARPGVLITRSAAIAPERERPFVRRPTPTPK